MEDDIHVTTKEMSIVRKDGRMNPSLMIPIDAQFQFVKPIVFMGCVQVPIFARVKLDGKKPNTSFLKYVVTSYIRI